METVPAVALAAGLALIVGLVSHRLIARSGPTSDGPTRVDGAYRVPTRLDRTDFADPHAPWLVVVFSSDTCSGCSDTLEAARQLTSSAVAVQEVEVVQHDDLHARYGIDAVPTTVVCDDDGDVRRWFLGPTSAADLWGAVAELRDGEE